MAFFAPAVSGFQSFGTDCDSAPSGHMATFAATSQGKSLDHDFDGINPSAMFVTAKSMCGMAQKAAKAGDPGAGNACLHAARLLFRYIRMESEQPEPNLEQVAEAGMLLPQYVMLAEENGANKEALGQFCYDYGMFTVRNIDIESELLDDNTKKLIINGIIFMMGKAAELGNAEAAEFLENLDDED